MARSLVLGIVALAVTVGPLAAQTGEGDDFQVRLRRAEDLARAGRLQDAENILRTLLDSRPAAPAPILALGRVLRSRGEVEELLPVLERALELEPRSVFLRQSKLRTLSELGREDELRRAGEDWLEATPGSEVAYREVAAFLERLGDPVEAERVLQAGLTRADARTPLAVALADLYLRQGRWTEAAERWLDVLRGSKSAPELVAYKLGALGEGARPAAEATLEVLSESEIPGVERLAALAAAYADRPERARQLAEQALQAGLSPPEARSLMVRLGRVAADRGHEDLAGWAYRQLLGNGVRNTRLDVARRVVDQELAAGDTAAALDLVGKTAAGSEPGTAVHRWALEARVRLLAERDADGATQAYEAYTRAYPDGSATAALAAAVAEARLRAGQLEEARRLLERVSRAGLDPSGEARLSVIGAYLALYERDYEKARAALEGAVPALQGDERNRAIRVLRFLRSANEEELRAVAAAHRLSMRGRTAQAFSHLWEALDAASPSEVRPALILWAGELALAGSGFGEAEEALRRVVREYPTSGEAPVALMALAEAISGAGRDEEAIPVLERLILEYPNSGLTPLARRRLAELREEVPSS